MRLESVKTALRNAFDVAATGLLGPGGTEHAAQAFWSRQGEYKAQMAHWCGAGVFADPERWKAVGLEHVELVAKLAQLAGKYAERYPVIVEWGCGGGANAYHFARLSQRYYGIDVSQDTLEQCAKHAGGAFRPVLIPADLPEAAVDQIRELCDLFLCTYVFEVFPSPDYGLRVLTIASNMLRVGGLALIQMKYTEGYSLRRPLNYQKNFSYMTRYQVPAFWKACQGRRLKPHSVVLKPEQPIVEDADYAYFLLERV